MKAITSRKVFAMLGSGVIVLLVSSCATTSSTKASAERFPSKYVATDGRVFEIGSRSPADGGWNFKHPRFESCWIADGFNFTGYDTLYIAPTLSTAKLHNEEEEKPHALAKENIVVELERQLRSRNIFPNIATQESEIKPGAHVLKLEDTIVEYAKGGGAARYFVGLFGGGQPVLVVDGRMTDGGKTVFRFRARRSGVSAGARVAGVWMSDVAIQTEDIQNFAIDLTDFMEAISGKAQPKS